MFRIASSPRPQSLRSVWAAASGDGSRLRSGSSASGSSNRASMNRFRWDAGQRTLAQGHVALSRRHLLHCAETCCIRFGFVEGIPEEKVPRKIESIRELPDHRFGGLKFLSLVAANRAPFQAHTFREGLLGQAASSPSDRQSSWVEHRRTPLSPSLDFNVDIALGRTRGCGQIDHVSINRERIKKIRSIQAATFPSSLILVGRESSKRTSLLSRSR